MCVGNVIGPIPFLAVRSMEIKIGARPGTAGLQSLNLAPTLYIIYCSYLNSSGFYSTVRTNTLHSSNVSHPENLFPPYFLSFLKKYWPFILVIIPTLRPSSYTKTFPRFFLNPTITSVIARKTPLMSHSFL